jgi:GNAT superfamily N-acetyltransferase
MLSEIKDDLIERILGLDGRIVFQEIASAESNGVEFSGYVLRLRIEIDVEVRSVSIAYIESQPARIGTGSLVISVLLEYCRLKDFELCATKVRREARRFWVKKGFTPLENEPTTWLCAAD